MTESSGWHGLEAYDLPDDIEPGAYAERCVSWHTLFAIVLDFLVPVELRPSGDVADGAKVPLAVARVRLPVGAAFDLIRDVSDTMGRYEREFGEIHRPQWFEEGGPA